MLTAVADAAKKTLTISAVGGGAMQPMAIKNIYFGDSTKDAVLCQNPVTPSSSSNDVKLDAYYTIKTAPVLTGNFETVTMTNSLSQYPELDLTLSVVQKTARNGENILKVGWKYANP